MRLVVRFFVSFEHCLDGQQRHRQKETTETLHLYCIVCAHVLRTYALMESLSEPPAPRLQLSLAFVIFSGVP